MEESEGLRLSQHRTQDRGGSVRWAGQGVLHGRCGGSGGAGSGSGVISAVWGVWPPLALAGADRQVGTGL